MMLMSLQRIQTLVGSQIRTAEMDAEQKQLTQSLGNRLLQHSGEFLNAWLTVYNEYAPLVRGVSSLLARVSNSQPAEG